MTRAPASASRQLHIGAATACSSATTSMPERGSVTESSYSMNAPRPRNRHVDKDLILLQARFVLVLGVDVLDRAFAAQFPRQDHHPDETAWPIRCGLREHSVGT